MGSPAHFLHSYFLGHHTAQGFAYVLVSLYLLTRGRCQLGVGAAQPQAVPVMGGEVWSQAEVAGADNPTPEAWSDLALGGAC